MKIHCNIVRDLMPSYIDHICSEETGNLVEEHIKACEECRMVLEGMKDTQVNMAGDEALQIDHMKKIRNRYNMVSLGSYLLLFLMMLPVIYFTCKNGSASSAAVFMIILPIMILASFLMAGSERKFTKKKACICGFSLFLFLCQFGLMRWVACICSNFNAGNDRMPFGMEIGNFGPFIRICLFIFMAGELMVMVYSIVNGRLKNTDNSYCAAISVTGIILSLSYINMLKMLEDFNTFLYLINKVMAVLTAELIILLICYKIVLRLKSLR